MPAAKKNSHVINPKGATKRIRAASDTSSTSRSGASYSSDATSAPIFNSGELVSEELSSRSLSDGKKQTSIVADWFSKYWTILAPVVGLICCAAWYVASIDFKVARLNDEMKSTTTSVDQLKIDGTISSTRIEQIQKSVDRLEDRYIRTNSDQKR